MAVHRVARGPKPDPDALAAFLRSLLAEVGTAPHAILVVSAHWEAPEPTVMGGETNSMLYDYSGFPAHTYELESAA